MTLVLAPSSLARSARFRRLARFELERSRLDAAGHAGGVHRVIRHVAWRAARARERRVVSGSPSLHVFTRAEEPAVW